MSTRWVWALREGVALPIPGLLLAGRVISAPAPRAADFSFHAAMPPVDIASACLQLVGLDGATLRPRGREQQFEVRLYSFGP